MVKRTVSFSDYQEPTWEEYTGEDPPVGKWFVGQVTKGKYDAEKDSMMFIVEITDPDSPFKGWGRAWFADFEGETKWKFHSILKSLQGGQTKDVTLDWANEKLVAAWLAKQKPIKFKTGKYNDRVNLDRVAPMLEGVPTAKKAVPGAGLAEPDELVQGDDEPVEDYTEEELTELKDAELIEILKEEFDVPDDDEDWPKKSRRDRDGSVYHKALVDFVLDVQDDDEEGDAEQGDDAEGEFDDGFDDTADTADPEPEPDPEPAPRTRRSRATKAAPAAAPAKAAAAPATGRRRRG